MNVQRLQANRTPRQQRRRQSRISNESKTMNILNLTRSSLLHKAWTMAVTCAMLVLVLAPVVGDAGITRTGITFGRAMAFGSVFVNGRKLETMDAAIRINGRVAAETELKLGQILQIDALHDDELPIGSAIAITAEDVVQGPIEFLDDSDGEMAVLGQTIFFDETTIVAVGAATEGIDELALGAQVEVYGLPMSDGAVFATRIADRSNPAEFEVTARIKDVNPQEGTFAMNGLTVNHLALGSMQLESAGFVEGDLLEVRGSEFNTAGELVATSVRGIEILQAQVGDRGEVEGFITEFKSGQDFTLDDIRVTTSAMTEFLGGGTPNLGSNSSVEVRGQFVADGSLSAEVVSIRGAVIKAEAALDDASATGLTVLGIKFQTTGDSKLEPSGHFMQGEWVEVRSVATPPDEGPIDIDRARMVDDDDDNAVMLQGFVTAVGWHSLSIMDVVAQTDADTLYRDRNRDKITREEFFDALTEGCVVKAYGPLTASGSIAAEQLEFELD